MVNKNLNLNAFKKCQQTLFKLLNFYLYYFWSGRLNQIFEIMIKIKKVIKINLIPLKDNCTQQIESLE